MRRFNLSAWAVKHPALILFLIVMFGVAGLISYRSLGRADISRSPSRSWW